MPVNSTHKQYQANQTRWKNVRDCSKGQDAIKAEKTTYLPKPSATDESPENTTRYSQYLDRAVFVNVTGRTGASLVGAIFRKPLSIELPEKMEYINENTDGGGLTIEQLSKMITSSVMETARAGILIDYPVVEQGATLDMTKDIKSRLFEYSAESIINWKTEKKNGKTILSMVVLQESVSELVDAFESEDKKQYRVLIMRDGVYNQDIYNEELEPVADQYGLVPKKADGKSWSEIPFVFVGAQENNTDVDCAPLYDISQVNLAHYRNSADYEEGVFIHGQGTMFISSEMSNAAFLEANPNGVVVGARKGHFLGPNGNAELLQMSANNAAREAMLDKQDQMVSIGARLITSKSGAETAEAARIAASSESSVLSTVADNVSSAITQAIKFACMFMGADPEKVEFQLNKDFFDKSLTAQEIMAITQLADRGDIAQSDVRYNLRRAGFFKAGRTDEDIDQDVSESPPLMNFGEPMGGGGR